MFTFLIISFSLNQQKKPLNVEYLMMDSSLLLYPTGTPLTGIDFIKRLPCGESEQARRVCFFIKVAKTLISLNKPCFLYLKVKMYKINNN